MLGEMVDRGCASGIVEFSGASLEHRRAGGNRSSGSGGDRYFRSIRLSGGSRYQESSSQGEAPSPNCAGGSAIVNADDPHAEMLGGVNLAAHRVTFRIDRPADVTAYIDRLDSAGSRFRIRGFDRELVINSRLVGDDKS